MGLRVGGMKHSCMYIHKHQVLSTCTYTDYTPVEGNIDHIIWCLLYLPDANQNGVFISDHYSASCIIILVEVTIFASFIQYIPYNIIIMVKIEFKE